MSYTSPVALFTRAWIEILIHEYTVLAETVALFTRAWIEMLQLFDCNGKVTGRPLHEGVD